MITVKRTYTRADRSVPWHIDQPYETSIYTQEFKDHVQATYANKMIHAMNSVGGDGLVLNFVSFWETLEDYQVYLNDPICQGAFARRDEHNTFYNIISSPSEIE